ncbi:MAG: hypothetical protein SFY66_06400 [Oculatellaceae cyanobacterium bins.114]|nr:hypothetical protein [Oculatellaceae cyanobacterium bins.114]
MQSKCDRLLSRYDTIFRSDGLFRQMFVNEEAIAAVQTGEPLEPIRKLE